MGGVGDGDGDGGGLGAEAASNRPHGSFGVYLAQPRIDMPCIGFLNPHVPALASAGVYPRKSNHAILSPSGLQ